MKNIIVNLPLFEERSWKFPGESEYERANGNVSLVKARERLAGNAPAWFFEPVQGSGLITEVFPDFSGVTRVSESFVEYGEADLKICLSVMGAKKLLSRFYPAEKLRHWSNKEALECLNRRKRAFAPEALEISDLVGHSIRRDKIKIILEKWDLKQLRSFKKYLKGGKVTEEKIQEFCSRWKKPTVAEEGTDEGADEGFKLLASRSSVRLVWCNDAPTSLNELVCRQLMSEHELETEGEEMGHCCGGYGEACKDNTAIFALSLKRERATVEVQIEERRVTQVKGRANKHVSEEMVKAISAWAEEEGLALCCQEDL